jgi:hypothetical protein
VGNVAWNSGDLNGNFFGGKYKKVTDPQCVTINATVPSLAGVCTLTAVADQNGNIVLQNPKPGTRGNLGQNVIEMPGVWTLDMSMAKRIKITESKRMQIRLDATNILNHPQPANPDLNINSTVTFGNIATKTGNRQFQAMMRLDF